MFKIGAFSMPVSSSALTVSGAGSAAGLKGEYFNNREMKGEPALVRTDAEVNFDWGSLNPAAQVVADNFSIRWTGKLTAPESGKYLLGAAGMAA